MKKRIFIAIHYLEIGGAEISLIGLLNTIDYSLYDVDLFVYRHQGELMKLIPESVNLLPEKEKYAQIESPIIEPIKKGYWDIVLARLWSKIQYRRYTKRFSPIDSSAIFQYIADNVTPLLPSLHEYGEYDLAISFLTPHNIVLDKVLARKKIAWIHTDYSKIDIDVNKEFPVWKQYDNIVSISLDVTRNFLKRFPLLESKIVEISNILSPSFVRKRSEEFVDMPTIFLNNDGVKLLSVGRFSNAKNFDNVPVILSYIRNQGINAYWYLIGYGNDENFIRENIIKYNMEDYVIILGKKENPYPYIKKCDIYIQPSRYEGNSVTVREAQMLCKPIIVTDYPTARSQVKHGFDGIIVPIENKECANGIVQLILNTNLREALSEYLSSHDYGNEKEILKLYSLI